MPFFLKDPVDMNRAGILAGASALHGSPTMAISWPAFLKCVQETIEVVCGNSRGDTEFDDPDGFKVQ